MQVKTVNATEADKISAKVLFDSLFALRDLYWPDQKPLRVLDAFARNGQLTVSQTVGRPKTKVSAWELGVEHMDALEQLGCDEIKIGCSYKHMEEAIAEGKEYDLIVIDTPQGLHNSADGKVRVEHFDFLAESLDLMPEDGGVFVLYVNTSPYDAGSIGEHGYDKYHEYDFGKWMEARTKFYGQSVFPIDMAVEEYRARLESWGYSMEQVMVIPCLSDVPDKEPYAYRIAFKAQKLPF